MFTVYVKAHWMFLESFLNETETYVCVGIKIKLLKTYAHLFTNHNTESLSFSYE